MIQRSSEARLSILEDKAERQAIEIQRLRDFRHLVEKDRTTLRFAIRALHELRRELPRIAREIADQAVAAGFTERDKRHKQAEDRLRVNFRDLALIVFATLALASFLLDHHLL